MSKVITALFIFQFLVYSQVFAQTERIEWGVETDPLSTAFGARTLSLVIAPPQFKHLSLFTNVVHANFPNWMDDLLNPKNKGKGFDSRIRIGGGFGIDYFFKEEREGFYAGLLNLFFQNEISRGAFSETIMSHNLIPRLGYRWFPFAKTRFYLSPFVGLRYEYSLEEVPVVDGIVFEAAGLRPFCTLHIGFHF